MSPDSAVARYARDIDAEHRAPQGRAQPQVAFITRPHLYCTVCGARAEEHVYGAIRREVWCANAQCVQHGLKLNIFDPVIGGTSHA